MFNYKNIYIDDWYSIIGPKEKSDGNLKKYNDCRIKIINRENGGLSAARNTGMKAAIGKYILFLEIMQCNMQCLL